MSRRRDLETLLADLNEPQRQAVTHRDGPLLVLAGPGSGKTRVITRRAAHLVRGGVPPGSVLAITFTNKAAMEMRRRVEELGVGRGMWVYTFHAFGVRILRELGPRARVQPGFSIYDEDDRLRCIKEAMALCRADPQLVRPELAQTEISDAKNKLISPQRYHDMAERFESRTIANIYEHYERLLEQRNAVDFDDLLMRVAIALRDDEEFAERLGERFRYLLIDEYQDTNHAQYLIARRLSMRHRNICVTGDPDQSIYAWRGADIGNILEFERDYPDALVVRLEQNYRSTQHILRAASAVIACNQRRKHKELWSERGDGEPVRVWSFANGDGEAERVADEIAAQAASGAAYSDFAVFYRVNALSRGVEESLRMRGIPYRIARGVAFYARREIRDLVAYLRVLVNPHDEVALLRIINTPARGIGDTTVQRLRDTARRLGMPLMEVLREAAHTTELKRAALGRIDAFCALLDKLRLFATGDVADAVSNVLAMSGLEAALREEDEVAGEDRLANAQELVTAARRYEQQADEPALADFLAGVALVSDQDAVDESAGVVMLMTLHAAKGLEFPVVFMIGLEQGMLPHERSIREGDVEEERRLCFVGMTRAQRRLHLSHTRQRVIRGSIIPQVASQFLRELPEDGVERESFVIEEFGGDASAAAAVRDWLAPVDDDAPSRVRPGRRRGRRWAAPPEDEPVFTPDDPAGGPGRFAGWHPGMRVEHRHYGMGTLEWVRPGGGGQTRASVRFAGGRSRTFILEVAPIRSAEGV